MSLNRMFPVAVAEFRRRTTTGNPAWIVVVCPFCNSSHFHDAGKSFGDPYQYLGVVQASCSTDDEPRQYELIASRHRVDVIQSAQASARVSITPVIRSQVWDKTDGKCWYCKCKLHPFRDFQIDHIVPVSRGGITEINNLVPACSLCNSSKGSRPMDVFLRDVG